jgi:hypothetical protein
MLASLCLCYTSVCPSPQTACSLCALSTKYLVHLVSISKGLTCASGPSSPPPAKRVLLQCLPSGRFMTLRQVVTQLHSFRTMNKRLKAQANSAACSCITRRRRDGTVTQGVLSGLL